MIRIIRRNVRLLLLFICTPGFYFIGWFPVWMASRWLPNEPIGWRVRLLGAWARCCCRIIGLRIDVSGTPPERPYLLVSNHVSYLDILVYYAITPSTFLSKAEVKRWPMLGWMSRTLQVLYIRRDRIREIPVVLEWMKNHLQKGEGIVLFPEGTTSDGTTLMPFRSPFLAMAAEEGLPVHLSVVHYRTPEGERPASDVVGWADGTPLHLHVKELLTLPSIECRVRFDPNPISSKDRKELVSKLMDRASEIHSSLRAEP